MLLFYGHFHSIFHCNVCRRVGRQLSRVATRDAIIVCKGTSLKRNCTKVVSVQKVVRPPCVRRRRGNRPRRKKKCLHHRTCNVVFHRAQPEIFLILSLLDDVMHILIATTKTEYLIMDSLHNCKLNNAAYKLLFSALHRVDFLVTIKLYF